MKSNTDQKIRFSELHKYGYIKSEIFLKGINGCIEHNNFLLHQKRNLACDCPPSPPYAFRA